LGAIHGDFNLQNILFGSEQEQVGWLIDFERSQDRGMVAFDFAKLEVEIWIHHLTPSLVNLAALWPQGGEDKPHYRLLDLALRAVEFEGNSAEFFTAQLANPTSSRISNLDPIDRKRPQGDRRHPPVCPQKLQARHSRTPVGVDCLFLNSAKFPGINPWSSICAFLASAWHLAAVMPTVPNGSKINDKPNDKIYHQVFQKIALGARGTNLRPEIDCLLIELQNHPGKPIQYQEDKK
jgi:hypothetical protein